MNKLRFSRLLMIGTIILIAAVQFYWLKKLYHDEEHSLLKTVDVVFRESMYKIQAERLKADTLTYKGDDIFLSDVANLVRTNMMSNKPVGKEDSVHTQVTGGKSKVFFSYNNEDTIANPSDIHTIRIIQGMEDSMRKYIRMDSLLKAQAKTDKKSTSSKESPLYVTVKDHNSNPVVAVTNHSSRDAKISFTIQKILQNDKTLNDTISIKKIDSAYTGALVKNGIILSYTISKDTLRKKDTLGTHNWHTSQVPVGLMSRTGYQANFSDPSLFLLKKISPQILLSLLLLAFTTASFIFLYRNLLAHRQIAVMKNDLISNITHELKTPIATVSVAIEALRNFGGMQSPERTKEYLDISAAELQRLGLLVDNVLRFSLFENKEITLQKEPFDLRQLTREVMTSMKLQFEKQGARTSLETNGEHFVIEADRLHITSVIYNLLDNALKYSKEDPLITVHIIDHAQFIELRVSDNGIGIAEPYKHKIFEQFFRVPGDDRHTVKGYGLGLSYVAHIVRRHQGLIEVESEPGKGSTFSVKLPFKEAPVITYDKGRKVIKRTIKLGGGKHED